MTRFLKVAARAIVPLAVRKHMVLAARAMSRRREGFWWTFELLRDWAERDPNAFHRFLWAHHLAYAETYDVATRFGKDQIHPTRRMLFEDLRAWLEVRGAGVETIESVFEVGCSLGYLLRHLETGLFRKAEQLEGIDIDALAIAEGSAHLAAIESRVRIVTCDMGQLENHLGARRFDLTLCAGVLMYLRQPEAAEVVRTILRHTNQVAAFAGLAHPDADNAALEASSLRDRDGTWIHNIDRMVAEAGGRVAWRRWEGPRQVDGNTIYFVLAEPGW